MDFDQIATFVEVAHQGSFSRAAQQLYRTQPAISTQMRLLEKQCGQPLFVRHARKVELTVAGKILLRYGERLRELDSAALAELKQMRRQPRGRLVLAANEATVLYVLPSMILQFQRDYPDVRLEIIRNFSRKTERSSGRRNVSSRMGGRTSMGTGWSRSISAGNGTV
mgnify:CR=1 FL=1